MSSPSSSSTEPGGSEERPRARPRRESDLDGNPVVAVLLFAATTFTCFMVYGVQWAGGDPLSDPGIAADSLRFAGGLMAILLAHEMGHYIVARLHGFRLSLPYFLPLPFAFGTLGAIIRLRTLPRSRRALLEMGAAGPIAGFVVSLVVLFLGLPATEAFSRPEIQLAWPPPPPEVLGPLEQAAMDALMVVDSAFQAVLGWLPGAEEPSGEGLPLLILANPLAMDLVGELVLGRVPGRYDSLGPFGLAGWAGCLLTGINLLPIGQLDGGHIFNGLAPSWSRRVSKGVLVLVVLGGALWAGWIVWALLLWVLRAWVSLEVPEEPGLPLRARVVAVVAVICFVLSFMPRPLELEELPYDRIDFVDEQGQEIPAAEVSAWQEEARAALEEGR